MSHHNCFSEGTKWTMIEKKRKKNCSSTFGDVSYRNFKKISLQFILWCPRNLLTLKWQWCPEEIIDGMKLFNSKLGIVNFEYIKLKKLITAQHCSKTVKFQWIPARNLKMKLIEQCQKVLNLRAISNLQRRGAFIFLVQLGSCAVINSP